MNVHSSIIHNSPNWEQPKGLLTDEGGDKIGRRSIEYSSTIKWKKLLTHACYFMAKQQTHRVK